MATKVGRYPNDDPRKQFDFSPARVKESFELSLKRLGVDYVDVIQVSLVVSNYTRLIII